MQNRLAIWHACICKQHPNENKKKTSALKIASSEKQRLLHHLLLATQCSINYLEIQFTDTKDISLLAFKTVHNTNILTRKIFTRRRLNGTPQHRSTFESL